MKNKKCLLCFVSAVICCFSAVCTESEESDVKKNLLLAGSEVLMCNGLLFSFNRFVTHAEYAEVTGDTIYTNLSNPWVWDQDVFIVNQLGHPYQGSFYFASGRANGFSFTESLLGNVLGSVTWEYFCENERPAINDLICTTFGGAAVGEMFHRLYVEASVVKSPLAFIISPVDALTRLITDQDVVRQTDDGITAFSHYIAAGPVFSKVSFSNDERCSDTSFFPAAFGIGLELVYGNPFTCAVRTPYSNFEFDFGLQGIKDFYSISIFSEGLLCRLGKVYGKSSKTMFGAVMNFDVVCCSIFNFDANALGFTCKSEVELPHNAVIKAGTSLGWLAFGGSDYYDLYRGKIELPHDGVERRLYDYGTGIHCKSRFSISQPAFGTFSVKWLGAGFFTISDAVPEKGSSGSAFMSFLEVSYEHYIKNPHAVGISASWYCKNGFYRSPEADNNRHNFLSVSLYGKRILK